MKTNELLEKIARLKEFAGERTSGRTAIIADILEALATRDVSPPPTADCSEAHRLVMEFMAAYCTNRMISTAPLSAYYDRHREGK